MKALVGFFHVVIEHVYSIVVVILLLLLLSPIPDFPDLLIADPVFNSVHIAVGAFLYLLTYLFLYDRIALGLTKDKEPSIAIAVFLISVAIAGWFEIIQPFFGRSRSVEDCILSTLGGLLTYAVLSYEGKHLRKLLGITFVFIFVTSIYPIFSGIVYSLERRALFPGVVAPENKLLQIINPIWGAKIETDVKPLPHIYCAVRIQATNQYAGIEIPLGYQDWSDYSALELSLLNLGKDNGILGVRVDDRKKNPKFTERFNSKVLVGPDTRHQTVSISNLKEIDNFEPKWIKRLLLFNNSSVHELDICLQEVKLKK